MITEWLATVDVDVPGASPADADRLAAALPDGGKGITDTRYDRITIYFVVEARTLRQAMYQADREVRAATSSAFGKTIAPVRALLRTQISIDRPSQMDLVGLTEIGEMLGVSRQRARQLAEDNDDFPRPVARMASGPVFTRSSIQSFRLRWPRQRTGRPPKERECEME
jgi:hypothetical protein